MKKLKKLHIKLLRIIRMFKLSILNDEQLKQAARTMSLLGFAALGAIGWPAVLASRWLEVLFTAIIFVLCEYIALLLLEDIEK